MSPCSMLDMRSSRRMIVVCPQTQRCICTSSGSVSARSVFLSPACSLPKIGITLTGNLMHAVVVCNGLFFFFFKKHVLSVVGKKKQQGILRISCIALYKYYCCRRGCLVDSKTHCTAVVNGFRVWCSLRGHINVHFHRDDDADRSRQ